MPTPISSGENIQANGPVDIDTESINTIINQFKTATDIKNSLREPMSLELEQIYKEYASWFKELQPDTQNLEKKSNESNEFLHNFQKNLPGNTGPSKKSEGADAVREPLKGVFDPIIKDLREHYTKLINQVLIKPRSDPFSPNNTEDTKISRQNAFDDIEYVLRKRPLDKWGDELEAILKQYTARASHGFQIYEEGNPVYGTHDRYERKYP